MSAIHNDKNVPAPLERPGTRTTPLEANAMNNDTPDPGRPSRRRRPSTPHLEMPPSCPEPVADVATLSTRRRPLMSLYPRQVTHVLTGEQSAMLYRELDKAAADKPEGPRRRALDDLLTQIANDNRDAGMAEARGDAALRQLTSTDADLGRSLLESIERDRALGPERRDAA